MTPGGIGTSPLIARITAPLSPEMNRSVSRTTRAGIRRSLIAARTDRAASSSSTATTIRWVPSADAAIWAPSRTRCGARPSRTLSLELPGSPSAPFTTTTTSSLEPRSSPRSPGSSAVRSEDG